MTEQTGQRDTAPDSTDESISLWRGRYRATTVGIVTLVTIAAFEHLGVSTAMPRMVAELHGAHLYSWPFTAFLAASVTATVLSGLLCDRLGPGPALLGGPALFLIGLLVAGTASGMGALLVGRAFQGLGLGTQVIGIYVLVALVYPRRSRPAAFGVLSAAWVVPSLVGPTAAGLVTEHLSWRWVFLGIAPFAVLGVLLLVRTLRTLPARRVSDGADTGAPPAARRRGVVAAAVATGFGVSALSWAVQHPSTATLPLGLAGVAALVPALRMLLPRGTFTARPGLPAAVLARGLFAGTFAAVEAFVPLTLTAVHAFSPAMAGVPLTVGAVGWSVASHWQGRHVDIPRTTLIRVAFLGLTVGLGGMALVGPGWGPAWLAVPCWLVAGASMGLGFPAVNVRGLNAAKPGERGAVSSALQVSDMTFAATLVGVGGVMLTTFASAAQPTAGVVSLNLLMAAVALGGALIFRAARQA